MSVEFIKSLKVLKNHQMESQDDINIATKTAKNGMRVFGFIGIVGLMLTIVMAVITITAWGNVSTLRGTIDSEFGPKFTDRKVFMAVEIQTANINGFNSGVLDTDLGAVQAEKKPKSTVAIVFRDLNGDLRLISEMETSNALTYKTFEYVGADYNPGSSATLLTTEYDRLNYKEYTKVATELASLESQFTFMIVLLVLMAAVTAPLLGCMIIADKRLRELGKITYSADDVLDASNVEVKKEIKKQGIGADGKAKEVKEKTAEEIIASEGGTFTGTK